MSLKKNVFANFVGSIWSALMGLAFVPFYIRFMGVESYGIVGVFASLMGILAVMDLGLSQAMNREMARLSADGQDASSMADTARTLELVYWGVALAVGMFIALLARPIAFHWLNPVQLARSDLQHALWIMGLVIALRWPVSLYMGGLNGMQRQVQLNVVLGVVATLQGVGALAVLWLVAPTIQVFFVWQAFMALVQVISLRATLWRNIPHSDAGRFNKQILNKIWHFAAGMSGIALLSTILTQLDKVILSKILPLSEFGYYTFAATVAAALFRLVGPIFTAYYPRMTELVSKKDLPGLVQTYHQGSQLMAAVILPIACVLAIFSREILEVWTHNQGMVLNASLLVSLLVIGNALNGLMNLPYALQLAHGWTKLAFYQAVAGVVLLMPALYFATLHWGALGAAGVWVILNIGYLLISVQVMHQYLLKEEKLRWYVNDVVKPLAASLAVSLAGWMLMQSSMGVFTKMLIIVLTLAVTAVAAIASARTLRESPAIRSLLRMPL